jgi:hypothetical protein
MLSQHNPAPSKDGNEKSTSQTVFLKSGKTVWDAKNPLGLGKQESQRRREMLLLRPFTFDLVADGLLKT